MSSNAKLSGSLRILHRPLDLTLWLSNPKVETPIGNFPKVKFKETNARISFGSIFQTRKPLEPWSLLYFFFQRHELRQTAVVSLWDPSWASTYYWPGTMPGIEQTKWFKRGRAGSFLLGVSTLSWCQGELFTRKEQLSSSPLSNSPPNPQPPNSPTPCKELKPYTHFRLVLQGFSSFPLGQAP